MAKDTANQDEALEKYAFGLFVHRSAGIQRRSAEVLTKECFRDAEAFINTSRKILAGEMDTKPPEGPQLSDVSAPNLKPTHPLNMVSKRFNPQPSSALERVKLIHNRLLKDPTLEAIAEYDWGKAEVLTAREVFPAYVGAN
jgi:hypothetical protein